MSLLVTGSIGIDTVEAPSGSVEDVLGGDLVISLLKAGMFAEVQA